LTPESIKPETLRRSTLPSLKSVPPDQPKWVRRRNFFTWERRPCIGSFWRLLRRYVSQRRLTLELQFLYKRFIPRHSLELHSVGDNSQGLDVLGPIEGSRFLMTSVVGQVANTAKFDSLRCYLCGGGDHLCAM
jgi:hypothetical protein